ncbi:MAG TPA: S-adenosylmethionine decarboxylase [Polyangiaceae bacterium]|nr:S-adenosylmethionine decarboxylase [Polyangiaceae bacterium]
MEWTHLTGGTEWLVDALECDPVRLRDAEALLALGTTLVAELELRVIGAPLLHRFDGPGGVTGLYLLSESHLAWHTYPEARLCTLNVYCCRPRPMLDWEALLSRTLDARRVRVTMVRRGIADAAEGERLAATSPEAPVARDGGMGTRP